MKHIAIGFQKQIVIILFILAAGMVISSCHPRIPIRETETTIPGNDLFVKAERKFDQKAWHEARKLYEQYLTSYPDGVYAPAALMKEAATYMVQGDPSTARSLYKYLMDKHPHSPQAADAMVEILVTFYKEGAFKEVTRQADVLMNKVKSDRHMAKIAMVAGDAYVSLNSPSKALSYYAAAFQKSSAADKPSVMTKLNAATKNLSTTELTSLLETIQDKWIRGFVMFQLGNAYIKEKNHREGIRILSDFVRLYPDHEYKEDANRLIEKRGVSDTIEPGKDAIPIGCLLPLSGAHQAFGNKALRGIELALREIGHRVNLIIKDTESGSLKAIEAVRELAEQNVAGIIGPLNPAEEAALEAQHHQIPIITLTQKENITGIGDYVFRNYYTPSIQVKAIASYAVEQLKLSRFAILYPDEKYGITFMTLFRDEILRRGKEVVASEAYKPSLTDFKGLLRKLKSGAEFEALFIPDGPKKVAMIAPQLLFYDDAPQIQLLGTSLWHDSQLLKGTAKEAVQGAILPEIFFEDSSSETVQKFVRAYRQTYSEKPDAIAAIAYDTAMMVFELIRHSSIRSGTDLRNELLRLKNFNGITGFTSYDEYREPQKQVYLLEIQGDKFIEAGTYTRTPKN